MDEEINKFSKLTHKEKQTYTYPLALYKTKAVLKQAMGYVVDAQAFSLQRQPYASSGCSLLPA